MKLSLFNGGLNIRQDPLLIAPNEAVECENVDTDTGVLKSAKGKTATTEVITNTPYYWEQQSEWQDRSGALEYMEYGDDLYWTATGRAQKYDGTTVNNLGIDAPSSAPTVTGGKQEISNKSIVAKDLGLTFKFTKSATTGTGAAASSHTFTLVMSYEGDIVYSEVKTIDLYGAQTVAMECTFDDSFTAVVYTPLDYSSVLDNINGVTVTVSAVPTLPEFIEDGTEVTLGVVIANFLTQTYPDPYEHAEPDTVTVTKEYRTVIIVTVSASVFGPASYPYSLLVYAKIGGTYYNTALGGVIDNGGAPASDVVTITGAYVEVEATQPTSTSPITPITPSYYRTWTPSGPYGVYNYVYTYYNEDDGTESAPSSLSEETNCFGLETSLSGMSSSSDSQVTHKRIYRVGGNISNFLLVDEILDSVNTYTDTTLDSDLSGTILDAILNEEPPDGLRYIKEIFGTFFGSVGSRLYFTRDIGNPNYWPSSYYIDFYDTITGIGVTASNAVVFTKYKAYAILGSSANTYSKHLLSGDQGCLNHDTIVEYGGQLIFVSTDGICTTQGSSITVLSKFKLGKQDLSTVNACIHDEVYYLQLADNSILAFDFRYEPNLKYYDVDTNYLLTALDTLYGRNDADDTMYTLFDGSDLEFTYKTGNLSEGEVSNLKTYNKIFVAATGTFTMYVYIDGSLAATLALSGKNFYELSVPQGKQRGHYIAYKIVGTGTLNEIEYKPVGRTSGE